MEALAPLIEPKEIVIKDRKGKDHTFIISLIPATQSREIVAKWTANALPKMGDYSVNEEMMFKILSYVAKPQSNPKLQPIRLVNRALIDNHVPDLKMLATLEKEMAQYNWDFFLGEEFSNLRERIIRIFSIWLTQIMTDSFRKSLGQEKQPSTN